MEDFVDAVVVEDFVYAVFFRAAVHDFAQKANSSTEVFPLGPPPFSSSFLAAAFACQCNVLSCPRFSEILATRRRRRR